MSWLNIQLKTLNSKLKKPIFIKSLYPSTISSHHLYKPACTFAPSIKSSISCNVKISDMESLFKKSPYLVSIALVCAMAMVCFPFTDWMGYRSVALLLLLTVSVLAMRLSLYPVLVAAFLSALIWDFFFIPPRFTFSVASGEDKQFKNNFNNGRIHHFISRLRLRFCPICARYQLV